jgi:hypothetical protein
LTFIIFDGILGKMITSNDAAYMAGVVDGEGTITLCKQIRKSRPSPSYKQMVTVSNCDLRILQPFVDKYKGVLYTHKVTKAGHSDCSVWHCPMSSIKSFLEDIKPYLRGKLDQANELLSFIERKGQTERYKGTTPGKSRGGSHTLTEDEIQFRESVWLRFKTLNARGKFKMEG